MRIPLIVGAQKLYLKLQQSIEFSKQLIEYTRNKHYSFEIAVCPSFINLAHVSEILTGSQIKIGAQNVHQECNGAFTGQVAINELKEIGVKYIIVGHSELRKQQGETNQMIREKVRTCIKKNVSPIVCVGENMEQKETGRSEEVIKNQLGEIFLEAFKDKAENIIIAYEPVWAIKAGRNDKNTQAADSKLANNIHKLIRSILSTIYGDHIAEKIRIMYGGSVDQNNSEGFLMEPSIDGLLIGTASTKIESFKEILEVAEKAISNKVAKIKKEEEVSILK